MKKVAIIMGSDSDLHVMREAALVLEKLGVEYEMTIVSAHRTPERMYEYAKSARDNGFGVIIAGAGGAAHLPGMTAAITTLPVIGVPIKSKALKGVDSLYSIVQMPRGVPVATMAINGAENAGIMAARILGVQDDDLHEDLVKYKHDMRDAVLDTANNVETRVGV